MEQQNPLVIERMLKLRKFQKSMKEVSEQNKFISGDSSWRMLKDEAGFV
jgi:hypothetical protein